MKDPSGILDPRSEERLRALREQKLLLHALEADVALASQGLEPDLSAPWRSPAQRGFAERMEELRGDLRAVGRHLDDALRAVAARIATEEASQ